MTGPKAIRKLLSSIDVDAELKAAVEEAQTTTGTKLTIINRKIRYLKALQDLGLNPTVYMMHNVPVIPPIFRPTYVLDSGDLATSEVNAAYRALGAVNKKIKEIGPILSDKRKGKMVGKLYDGLKALEGLGNPITSKPYKGILDILKGKQIKSGFFHNTLIRRLQEPSGRAAITLEPSYHLDEAGIPEKMAWKVYEPFVIRKLITNGGMSPMDARKNVETKSETAKTALEKEIIERPMMLNRAPSLHRWSIMAFQPRIVPGESIVLNPLVCRGFNADFDGDCQDPNTPVFVKIDNAIHYLALGKLPKGKLIKKNDRIDFYEPETSMEIIAINAEGDIAWRPIDCISYHKNVKLFKVSTKKKRISNGANTKSFVTANNEYKLENLGAEIEPGKLIAINNKKIELPVVNKISFKEWKRPKIRKGFPDSLDLDFDLGYLFGVYTGDGWSDYEDKYQRGYFYVSNSCNDLVEKVRAILKTKFNLYAEAKNIPHPHVFKGHKSLSHKICFTSIVLASFLSKQFGRKSIVKKIPSFVYTAPQEFKMGFLSGLIDTDGGFSISGGRYYLKVDTVSTVLADNLMFLLKTLGINAKAYPYGGKYKVIYISQNKVLGKCIFSIKEKQKKLEIFLNKKKNYKYCGYDLIPFYDNMQKVISSLSSSLSRKSYPNYMKARKKNYLTRSFAKKIIEELDLDAREESYIQGWVRLVNNTDIEWDIIKKVTLLPNTLGCDLTTDYKTFMLHNFVFAYDCITAHIPVSDNAVEEAKQMMPSKHLFKSGYNDLLVMPSQGALLGLYYMTHQGKKDDKMRTFSDMDALDQAYQRNEIRIDTPIQVRHSPVRTTTYGREILEQALPSDVEIPKEFNKVTLSEFIKGISGRKDAVSIINTLKDLGFQYVYQAGASLGLDDFPKVDLGPLIRGTTLDIERKISQGEIVTKKALKERGSLLHPIIESGSRAKWRQAMEMTAAPGFYSSIMEKVIPLRIDKSYAEGLTPGQFWASTYGARKAEIGKSLMTALPGDLAKTMLATMSDVVITDDDMGDDGIEMSIKDPDIVDRFTAKDVTEGDKVLFPRNTLITDEVLDTLKKRYVMRIPVRSPLTACNPHGIPARSFGLHEDGNLPEATEAIGIRASQALSEPLTQTALGSFHSGQGLDKRKKASYWDVEKLLIQPREVKNATVLSPVEGEITEVKKQDDGLYEISIRPEGKKSDISTKSKLFFPPIVKKDDKVKKGQGLTLGDTDYRELLKLVGLKDMQLRLTHDLHDAYHNIGIPIKQRYVETVVRKLTDNARVTDIGGSNYSPGDWVSVYELEDYNRRRNPDDKPVGYELVPAGIKTRVSYEENWPKRLVFGQKVMKNSITEGASQKWSADLFGDSPWTTWLVGGDGEVNIDEAPGPA